MYVALWRVGAAGGMEVNETATMVEQAARFSHDLGV